MLKAEARQPRYLIKLNDEITISAESFEVDNNTFYQADTFRVCFAIAALPADRSPSWWSSQSHIAVEIFAGFPRDAERFTANELTSLIYGMVDDVSFDPAYGKIVVSGRDMTSVFIDSKTTEKWVNQTSSEIAKALAVRHGLAYKVTDTKTKTGRYYEIDHARLTDQRTEWDLLTWLAHEEQFMVYVKGNVLHFEPRAETVSKTTVIDNRPAIQKEIDEIKAAWSASLKKSQALLDSASADWDKSQATKDAALEAQARQELAASKAEREGAIAKYQARLRELERQLKEPPQIIESGGAYVLRWEPPTESTSARFNGKSIEFSRNLTLAKGVVVSIRSWNGKSGKAFTVSYPTNKAKGTAPGNSSPVAQVFPFTIPGLTQEQALQKAQALHKEITAQEVKLHATLPADNILDVTSTIKVIGTGTAFDQIYYPESITRSMSVFEGYTMHVRAKNHSPESVVPA